MNPNGRPLTPEDLEGFNEKCNQVPTEYIWQFIDQHVAWDPRTMKIVASADSSEALDQRLEEMGIHFSQVVHAYVDDPNVSTLECP